ncbi:HNH endonuclease [Neolewinella antarctica]|uniref:HNH nuclease domain-containing protein n=1 Tax=Neolewinella antarctica TaxID=442734 RepID=A0ABX0XEI9_9BACT|nr:HNH endonuclease signature motif containing protein [Neolewinella antarctica]NJC27167.1 hypothetical protein [Neolewinella antarctica]
MAGSKELKMSSAYISPALRAYVRERSREQCEYCLRSSLFYSFGFHVDHIISQQHGGDSAEENLAWSCPECNVRKGTNLGTYLTDGNRKVWLFDPRKQVWRKHLKLLNSGEILGKSDSGKGTVQLLRINERERVEERKLMMLEGYRFFAAI